MAQRTLAMDFAAGLRNGLLISADVLGQGGESGGDMGRFEPREGVRPVLIATDRLVYKPQNLVDNRVPRPVVGIGAPLNHFYVGKPPLNPYGVAILKPLEAAS